VANHRLKKQKDGTHTNNLKTPWNGQITHAKFSGEELMEKLMAIIPTPRAHMSKHCGVFSSHHRLREQIILRPEIKKGFFLVKGTQCATINGVNPQVSHLKD